MTVRQTDAAGNQSTAAADVVKDTHVWTPTVQTSTGASAISASGSVTVGNIESGATWHYSLDDGQTWTQGSGSSIAAGALSEGTNHITVRETDAAGNVASTMIDVTKDSIAQSPTVMTSSGGTINGTGSVIVGGIEAGATWDYSLDSGQTWTPGSGSSIAASALGENANLLTVRQTDALGNVGQTTVTVVKDTIAAAPTLALTNDSGDGSDRLTYDGRVSVAGIEAGATWEYSIDGGAWVAGGQTGLIADPGFTDGAHAVRARQTDAVGNASQETGLNFNVDKSAPAKPGAALYSDTGVSGDRITNNPNLEVTGAEVGAKTEVFLNGWVYYFENKESSYVINMKDKASEGGNAIFFRQVDVAGNASAWSQINVTIDKTVATPILTLANDTGVSPTDGVTSDASINVSGLEAGGKWDYSLDGGQTWTHGSGTSISGSMLSEGTNHVTVQQTDAAGNQSTNTIDVVKDSVVAQPSIGALENGKLTIGNLESGAAWDYSLNGGTTWIHGTGTDLPIEAVSVGNSQLTVRQTDAAGNQAMAPLNVVRGTDAADVVNAPAGGGVLIGGGGPDAFTFSSQSRGTFVLPDYEMLPGHTVQDIERIDFSDLTEPPDIYAHPEKWIQMLNENGHTVARFDFDNQGDFSNPELTLILPQVDQTIWITWGGAGFFNPGPTH